MQGRTGSRERGDARTQMSSMQVSVAVQASLQGGFAARPTRACQQRGHPSTKECRNDLWNEVTIFARQSAQTGRGEQGRVRGATHARRCRRCRSLPRCRHHCRGRLLHFDCLLVTVLPVMHADQRQDAYTCVPGECGTNRRAIASAAIESKLCPPGN